MTLREEIKCVLTDEAIDKRAVYDLGDSPQMGSLFKEWEGALYEKYRDGYDSRFCEIVSWCIKRYESEIENRLNEVLYDY